MLQLGSNVLTLGAFSADLLSLVLRGHRLLLTVLEQALLLENGFRLRHNYSRYRFAFARHVFPVVPQTQLHFCFSQFDEVTELECELLTLLKQGFLACLVFASRYNILRCALAVQIRALVIQAVRPLEEKAAVLCPTERGVQKSAVENVLVN